MAKFGDESHELLRFSKPSSIDPFEAGRNSVLQAADVEMKMAAVVGTDGSRQGRLDDFIQLLHSFQADSFSKGVKFKAAL